MASTACCTCAGITDSGTRRRRSRDVVTSALSSGGSSATCDTGRAPANNRSMRTGRAGRGVRPGGAGGAAHSARSTWPAKSPLRGTNDTVPGAGVNSPGAAARSRCV